MQYKLKSLATPGVSQTNINAENLKSLTIPLPPILEQQKIASLLINIDKQKLKETVSKEIVYKLKKGLMQKLLTGKIRVKL